LHGAVSTTPPSLQNFTVSQDVFEKIIAIFSLVVLYYRQNSLFSKKSKAKFSTINHII